MFERETRREKILEGRRREMKLKQKQVAAGGGKGGEGGGAGEGDGGKEEDLVKRAEDDFWSAIAQVCIYTYMHTSVISCIIFKQTCQSVCRCHSPPLVVSPSRYNVYIYL